jgi:HEAT repeat protein
MEGPEEILDRALALPAESHERWDQIGALHKRGDHATFEAAADLLDSPDPARRLLGVDVLAQLGAEENVPVERRPFAAPAAQLLLQRLANEDDAEVLAGIATAFGHLRDPRCIPALHGLRGHPDTQVRHSVVFGLLGADDDLAVQTLIELSTDADAYVRDWATFGLGTQIDHDDPALRNALLARLEDPDSDTRGEAIRGLAARGDTRAIPQLLLELKRLAEHSDPGVIEQAVLVLASKTADERLCNSVRAMEREWQTSCPDDPPSRELQAAIDACSHAPRDPGDS